MLELVKLDASLKNEVRQARLRIGAVHNDSTVSVGMRVDATIILPEYSELLGIETHSDTDHLLNFYEMRSHVSSSEKVPEESDGDYLIETIQRQYWGDRWDLNPQPLGPQPSALPVELRPPSAKRYLYIKNKDS
jgi:hypothetical protein